MVHSSIRSFIHSFIHSVASSFIRPFVHLVIRSRFDRSFVHSTIRSFIRSFPYSVIRSLMRAAFFNSCIFFVPYTRQRAIRTRGESPRVGRPRWVAWGGSPGWVTQGGSPRVGRLGRVARDPPGSTPTNKQTEKSQTGTPKPNAPRSKIRHSVPPRSDMSKEK